MTEFTKLQLVKRRFFAMRNGIIADTLRKAGSPYRIIFGLNMPQLNEVARDFAPDPGLAATLRMNVSTRESQLLYPMLLDASALSPADAADMARNSTSVEAADVLCHSLLRHMPDSFGLALGLAGQTEPDMARYCAMRLLWHHLRARSSQVEAVAKAEADRGCRLTIRPAMQIIDEIDFWREENS